MPLSPPLTLGVSISATAETEMFMCFPSWKSNYCTAPGGSQPFPFNSNRVALLYPHIPWDTKLLRHPLKDVFILISFHLINVSLGEIPVIKLVVYPHNVFRIKQDFPVKSNAFYAIFL